jgi:uncharacterized membrane protein
MQYCSGCGKQVPDGVSACPACGKSITGVSGSAAGSQGGLNDNLAGALCYLFIPAIIFLAIEPYNRNPYVRFHAFQGLFLGLVSFVGHFCLGIIPVLGWVIMPIFSLLIFILAIIAAVKAFQGNKWHIPVIGDFAAGQAAS